MKRPQKYVNIIVAATIVLGVGLVLGLTRLVGADTVVAGYATARVHLEVTVCEKSNVNVRAEFRPPTGKKYYFKDRYFEVQSGLNTIEWYIRKIPGGSYRAIISSDDGSFSPSTFDVNLTMDIANQAGRYSLVICTPQPAEATSPALDEPDGEISVPTVPSPEPAVSASASSDYQNPGSPPAPSLNDDNDDLTLPV
ncbi:MAG: hypothetical protein OEV37_03865 [Candidatus Berkelbacteria bacterium]|nr:hypothetical protein [Candidatus Berkelbacteria bacterium]